MRKLLITQSLLCLGLGPIGLLYSSARYALAAMFFALVLASVFREYLLIIWLIAVLCSTVVGALLVLNNHRRALVHDFQLSSYVGTVSYRVDRSKRRVGSYQPLLNKLRFRRRAGKTLNTALGVLCVYFSAKIVLPDVIPGLTIRKERAVEQPSTVNDEGGTFNTLPLLSTIDDTRYTLRSNNFVLSQSGLHRAKLSLGCDNNRTYLSLTSTDALGTEEATVKVAIAGKPIRSSAWKIDHDYHTAHSPNPIHTLKNVTKDTSVAIRYQPFNTHHIHEAMFDSRLLTTAIDQVRRKCHW